MSENVQDSTPRLNPKQMQAVSVLLTARSITEAATILKVNEKTLRRWMSEPLFMLELRGAEASVLDDAVRRLLSLHDTALDTLSTILTDSSVAASVRMRAAIAILDTTLKLREVRSLEARLFALEAGGLLGTSHDTHTFRGT